MVSTRAGPWVGSRLKILGMACAAVLRTYGDMSPAHFLTAMTTMGTMTSIRMPDMTRSERARMNWLLSLRSCQNGTRAQGQSRISPHERPWRRERGCACVRVGWVGPAPTFWKVLMESSARSGSCSAYRTR